MNLKLKNNSKTAVVSIVDYSSDSDKYLRKIAKTVVSMTNAVGGDVYLSVKMKKGYLVAIETIPLDFPDNNNLNYLINEHINPQIQDLKITRPLVDEQEIIQIEVPSSLQKPHMFSDYKYYKRVLSRTQVMEEYEVRQCYLSLSQSSLQIMGLTNVQGIPNMHDGYFDKMKFFPRVHIVNQGNGIEKEYKLEIHIPSAIIDETFTILHKYLKGYKKNKNIYSIPGTESLFQEESKTLIELVLKLDAGNYTIFKTESIEMILYSTNKRHRVQYQLIDLFHYKGRFPDLSEFNAKIPLV